MMKVTYIYHSGFLVELDHCYLLFDYYKGQIPQMNPEKELFVFASHKHPDHYNPKIMELRKQYPKVTYILSRDIWMTEKQMEHLDIPLSWAEHIIRVKQNEEYTVKKETVSIKIRTLKSTDIGVAFIVSVEGKDIYHAGDLNLWLWSGESAEYNKNMKEKFIRQMERIKGLHFDVAFLPLDPRQEMDAYKGIVTFFYYAKADFVFPMHLWEKYDLIQKLKEDEKKVSEQTNIMEIERENQEYEI